MTEDPGHAPDDLPPELVERVAALDEPDLRALALYVHDLLADASPTEGVGDASLEELAERFAPNPGEELVRVTERDGYVEVVKWEPCGEDCGDCPHGPYLYHVVPERRPDDEVHQRWILIGELVDGEGGDDDTDPSG